MAGDFNLFAFSIFPPQVKSFLRSMGQPIDQESLRSILLDRDQAMALSRSYNMNKQLMQIQNQQSLAQQQQGYLAQSSMSSSSSSSELIQIDDGGDDVLHVREKPLAKRIRIEESDDEMQESIENQLSHDATAIPMKVTTLASLKELPTFGSQFAVDSDNENRKPSSASVGNKKLSMFMIDDDDAL
jgi:hypothetical protein